MKNTEKSLEQVAKLRYESPRMISSDVELENGIANTSGGDTLQSWKGEKTITQDVYFEEF